MNGTRTIGHLLDAAHAERFAQKHTTGDGCWLWQTATNGRGYGVFSVRNADGRWRNRYAHRVSYELHVGPIPDGLHIDHLCRNRLCVNPAHLEPVTIAENNARMAAVKTHCPRDHEYTEANTYVRKGARYCRTCNAESARRRTARRAQETE